MSHRHLHLVGVAGVGMNPLAQVLLAQGYRLTGSDRYLDTGQLPEAVEKLRRAGLEVFPQDGSAISPGTEAVVASTAVEDDNPDLAAARRLGVPIVRRAEMLARLARDKTTIAITGTSGKTTVTGMVGFALERLGADPTVVNGGIVVDWEDDRRVGNVRIGRSGPWVVEADESDRSLLLFRPTWAVVTNVSADHFGLEESRRLFEQFVRQVERTVIGWDDDLLESFAPDLGPSGSSFVFRGARFRVRMPGRHNAENALQAAALCVELGYPPAAVAEALGQFRGIRRRLEVVGTARGITVVDDYAHNPAKIRAAWSALAPHHRRVVLVWRPHGFGPLAKMFDDLVALFRHVAARDTTVLLLPVYYAGGTVNPTVTSGDLAERLAREGLPVEAVAGYDHCVAAVAERAREGDAVVVMGARDPELPTLARRILEGLDTLSA